MNQELKSKDLNRHKTQLKKTGTTDTQEEEETGAEAGMSEGLLVTEEVEAREEITAHHARVKGMAAIEGFMKCLDPANSTRGDSLSDTLYALSNPGLVQESIVPSLDHEPETKKRPTAKRRAVVAEQDAAAFLLGDVSVQQQKPRGSHKKDKKKKKDKKHKKDKKYEGSETISVDMSVADSDCMERFLEPCRSPAWGHTTDRSARSVKSNSVRESGRGSRGGTLSCAGSEATVFV